MMKQKNPFQIVSDICQQTGLTVLLVGGHALGAYGHQRFTQDVDFLIDECDLQKLKAALREKRYPEILESRVVSRFGLPDEGDIVIDLMPVDSETFRKMRFQAKEEVYDGRKFLVPKLEHLIAMKIHALREQFDVRKVKDLPDIVELIRRNKMDPQSEAFRSLCLKFGSAKVHEEILNFMGRNDG
ncbi:MAG: nucleotidyl transferase AbiEii/AbiGii toxin family protein [Candidatus Omnitrophica bacterium]|nr:nucleotidyl transferase AbiEii/AbiGii toxin family protein [Candidatus Omnitrophota bacterium]